MAKFGKLLYRILFPGDPGIEPAPYVESDASYRLRLLREIKVLQSVAMVYQGDRLDRLGQQLGMNRMRFPGPGKS